MIDKQQCEEKIRWVAAALHEPVEFRRRAQTVANDLGPNAIETLAQLFHSEHTPPAELADEFPRLGEWIAARQFAIFEMFYHFREAALTVLRRVAFGAYDWTQGNAIEILCRLAAEGIDRGRTLADLKLEIPAMQDTALLYAAGPLLHQASQSQELAAIIEELQQVSEFKEAVAELQSLNESKAS
jgi:hypothetical protein